MSTINPLINFFVSIQMKSNFLFSKSFFRQVIIFLLFIFSNSIINAQFCHNPTSLEDGLIPDNIFFHQEMPDWVNECSLMDGNLSGERWSTNSANNGEPVSFTMNFQSIEQVNQVKIAFRKGHERVYEFSISVSPDAQNWTTVLNREKSSGTSESLETFNFSSQNVKHLIFTGYGVSSFNSDGNPGVNNEIYEIQVLNTGSGNSGNTTNNGSGLELYTQSNAANPNDEANALTGWDSSSMIFTSDSGEKFNGSYGFKLVGNGNGANWPRISYEFNTQIGRDYEIKIHAKNAGGGNNTGFYLWEGFSNFSPQNIIDSGWKQYTFVLTADASTALLKIYTGQEIGNTLYIDNISITEVGSEPNNPPNTGESVWAANSSNSNIFFNDGNVGIGTNNPGAWKLAVNGNIRAKEVKVETGWADYVFFNDYNLPTLEEVENHIKEKGHLINIPSAAEVEANGIELGEMNKLLLEKIEELTLYILQMDKDKKVLDQRVFLLEEKIKK